MHLGLGWSLGMSAEWTRIPWTTRTGEHAHFDTVVIGPEGRFTFNRDGRILPHIYVGLGVGTLSVSVIDLNGMLSGGPAARAGVGLDFRVMPRLRLGVSAGVTLMPVGTTAGDAQPPYVDPGVPTDPGNVWSLRLGGRGEFL